jgi:hypothetical protein
MPDPGASPAERVGTACAGSMRSVEIPVNGDRFRKLALSFPEAVESSHMDHPDFRVRKRIFATLSVDETAGAVKCGPPNLDLLVQRDPETFRNAWGGRWLGIDLARVDELEAKQLLEDAWRLVASKSVITAYDGGVRKGR